MTPEVGPFSGQDLHHTCWPSWHQNDLACSLPSDCFLQQEFMGPSVPTTLRARAGSATGTDTRPSLHESQQEWAGPEEGRQPPGHSTGTADQSQEGQMIIQTCWGSRERLDRAGVAIKASYPISGTGASGSGRPSPADQAVWAGGAQKARWGQKQRQKHLHFECSLVSSSSAPETGLVGWGLLVATLGREAACCYLHVSLLSPPLQRII